MTAYTFSQLFDFTRTTAGTFVGSNGLIQNTPASVNLLTFTQEFDNASVWGNSVTGTGVAPTITANDGIAPDGTLTADRIQFSLGGGTTTGDITRRRQVITPPAGANTLSMYLRARDGVSTYNMHLVDVVGVTRNIVVTGAWQRFEVPATALGTSATFAVGLRGGQIPANSNTADVLAWGAQVEAASTATDYTRNVGGVYPARFDYDPVTLAPRGILIEEQRTNLVLRSETFSTTWANFGFTLDKNYTAPDGQNNATKIIPDNATTLTNNALQQDVSKAASSITYTVSIFAKAGEFNRLRLLVRDTASGSNFARATFNLGTKTVSDGPTVGGTFSAASVSYQDASEGFIRYCLTFTTGTEVSIRPVLVVFDAVATTGNGTSGIYAYGAQLEAGAFATSYIPTVASTVTRSADICTITAPMFSPWYNQSEGTFVVVADSPGVSGAANITTVDDGTVNERIRILTDVLDPKVIVTDGGVTQANIDAGAITALQPFNMSAAYALNDIATCLNGGAVGTDTSATLPTVTILRAGADSAGNYLNGHIRRITYYPFRASNNQLQALTT